jgi:hypothetical protein
MQNVVMVELNRSRFRNSKKDSRATNAITTVHGVSRRSVSGSKFVISNPLYDQICAVQDRAYAYHRMVTLPWQTGIAIVDHRALDGYIADMDAMIQRHDDLVQGLVADWADIVEEQAERLGPLFSRSDYPSADEIQTRFTMRYTVSPMVQDAHFDAVAEIVGTEVAQQLAAKLNAQHQEQWQAATRDVWQRLEKALQHAVNRFGNAQRVTGNILGDLQELADVLPVLNVNNDPELDQRRRELNALLRAYSTESVRDEGNRNACAAEVSSILSKLNF